jgi:hypothetical protein
MNKKYIFILLSVLFFSCKPFNPTKIDIEKLAYIITDIHIAENYASNNFSDSVNNKYQNKNTDTLKRYYQIIFNKYNVSVADFKHDYKYYQASSKLGDTLYKKSAKILDSIIKNIEAKNKLIPDSLS